MSKLQLLGKRCHMFRQSSGKHYEICEIHMRGIQLASSSKGARVRCSVECTDAKCAHSVQFVHYIFWWMSKLCETGNLVKNV